MNTPVNQLPDWGNYRGIDRSPYQSQRAAASYDEPDDVEWADYAKSIMGGGASLVQATGWLTKVLGAEDIGSSIETLGSDAVDYWNDSLSDPAKAEIAKEIIRKNDQGEYEWGDPSFSTVGLMGAQSLLGTAAGMGVGAGLTKVLQVFANPFGRTVLANAAKAQARHPGMVAGLGLTDEVSQAAKKLKLVDAVLGATGFGIGEGSIGGISAGASVYDNIMNMEPEKLMANERYRTVYESTDSSISELERHQYAADTVAKEASTAAGLSSGLTTALLGAPMGAYFGRILGGAKLSSNLAKGIATGAAGEAAQEFAQSGVEQYISNIKTKPFDPEIDDFDDVLNAAVGGALAGGLLGGGFGSASVGPARAELAGEAAVKDRERVAALRKIGGPLQTAAKKASTAGADEVAIMAIVNDAVEQKLDVADAMENLEALTLEQETGEPPVARKPAPAEPVKAEEKQLSAQEAETKLETDAQGPVEIEMMSPVDLRVDAPRFQFKAQVDAAGVSRALKGVKKFESHKAGLAIVWEDKAGTRFVVDGHQRVGLAKRAIEAGQDPAEVQMAVYVVREVDGVTPEMATEMAALKNIAEGTGSPIDAAKVMREMPTSSMEAVGNLPPTSMLVKQGKGLAALDDEAFGKAVNEVIDPRQAAIVGEMIPDDGALQNAAIEVLRQTEPANAAQARAIVDQVKIAGVDMAETEDLFGEEIVAESLYLERAKVLDSAMKSARRDKQIFKTLTSQESAIEGAGANVLDREANLGKISDADKALGALSVLANQKGAVSDALTEAARRVKAGEKPGAVSADFLTEAIRSIERGGQDGQPSGESKSGAARQPQVTPAAEGGVTVTPENLIAGEAGLYTFEAISARSPEVEKGSPVTTEAPTAETLFSRKKKVKPCGHCFENTGRYMMNFGAGNPDIVLVHGYVMGQGPIAGTRFAHSWIEVKNAVPMEGGEKLAKKDLDVLTRKAMDMTTDERVDNPLEMDAILYRSVGQAEVMHEYTFDQAMKKMANSGHFGPWDFEEHPDALALRGEPMFSRGGEQADAFTTDAAAQRRRQEIADEEKRRDEARDTGQEEIETGREDDLFSSARNQQQLFSRPISEISLTREFEIEETGEVVEIEQNAEIMLRQLDKRTGIVRQLRACVGG